MAQVPQEFAADFALAARHWLATGQTDLGIEDIRAHIRADLEAGRNVAEWAAWVKCIADFQRGLDAMVTALIARLRRSPESRTERDPRRISHHAWMSKRR